MAKYFDFSRSPWLFFLFVPLIIVLCIITIPFAIIGGIIDIPQKKKRAKVLASAIAESWVPAGKFVYISYKSDTEIGTFVRDELLSKYEKYIIADAWSDSLNTWSENWPDNENRVVTILQDIVGDYDSYMDLTLVPLDERSRRLNLDKRLILFPENEDSNRYIVNDKGDPITIADARKLIIKAIEDALLDWRNHKISPYYRKMK